MDGTIKRGHTNRVLLNVQVEPEFWQAILNAFGARQRLSWIPFQKCFTFFSQSSLHFALNDGFSCLSLCLPLFFTGNIKPQFQPPLTPAPSHSPRPFQSLHPPQVHEQWQKPQHPLSG